MQKKKNINQWLNGKVNDKTVPNKYYLDSYTIEPYYGKYNINEYYTENDSDLINNDIASLQYFDENLEEYVEEFPDFNLFIAPNSNRYHCNQLFKKLTDFSIKNQMEYNISDNILYLITPEFKEEFYQFCFENSF